MGFVGVYNRPNIRQFSVTDRRLNNVSFSSKYCNTELKAEISMRVIEYNYRNFHNQ